MMLPGELIQGGPPSYCVLSRGYWKLAKVGSGSLLLSSWSRKQEGVRHRACSVYQLLVLGSGAVDVMLPAGSVGAELCPKQIKLIWVPQPY